MKFFKITKDGKEIGYRENMMMVDDLLQAVTGISYKHLVNLEREQNGDYCWDICGSEYKAVLCEIPDYFPTVVASYEDLKSRYDCSGLTSVQMDNMLREVVNGMNSNDSVMECYWMLIDSVAEEVGLRKL